MLFFFIVTVFVTYTYAQENEYLFDKIEMTVSGDLNKDGLLDLIIVKQDTTNDFGTYLLEVFFTEKNGDKKLIVGSDKALPPEFPSGKEGWMHGNALDGISIKKGVLWIEMGGLRSYYEYKFRYQDGSFKLIGYTAGGMHHGGVRNIDYNLSTGKKVLTESTMVADGEEETSTTTESIDKLENLPELEMFEAFTDYFN